MTRLRAIPVVLSLVWVALSVGCSVSEPGPLVQVGPVVADSLVAAHRAQRPVLINTTSRWCQPCKQFIEDAVTSPALSRSVSVFEWITLDSLDDEEDCLALAVDTYPTFIILSPGGEALARWYGYAPPPEAMAARLVEQLLAAGRRFEDTGRFQQAYCLYKWAIQVGQPGPHLDAALEGAARLVESGKAAPNAQTPWATPPNLAARLKD